VAKFTRDTSRTVEPWPPISELVSPSD
jgi:hypothetical protein